MKYPATPAPAISTTTRASSPAVLPPPAPPPADGGVAAGSGGLSVPWAIGLLLGALARCGATVADAAAVSVRICRHDLAGGGGRGRRDGRRRDLPGVNADGMVAGGEVPVPVVHERRLHPPADVGRPR